MGWFVLGTSWVGWWAQRPNRKATVTTINPNHTPKTNNDSSPQFTAAELHLYRKSPGGKAESLALTTEAGIFNGTPSHVFTASYTRTYVKFANPPAILFPHPLQPPQAS